MSDVRPIDANKLKEKLQARRDNGNDDFDKGYNIGLDTAVDLIDSAPTVEYPFYQEAYQTGYEEGKNERPKGKWIDGEYGIPICSKCNSGYNTQPRCMGKPMFEFCPICGADMRGKEE